MTRKELAQLILKRFDKDKESLKRQYAKSRNKIGHFFIDDLLPTAIALKINEHFPEQEKMMLKKSLREHKHIAAQMNKYHPMLEEVIYAFQNEEVIACIKDICEIDDLYPDEHLYAG